MIIGKMLREKNYNAFFDLMTIEYKKAKVYDCAFRPFPQTIELRTKKNRKGQIVKVYICSVKKEKYRDLMEVYSS